MWYVSALEYYPAIKKNEIVPFAATWMDLESVILSEARQRRRNSIWHPLYVESKKKWYKWTYRLQSMGSQRVRHDWATSLHKTEGDTERTSLVAQTVKRLSTMWETWVRSLGREDPLEKEMAIHSSTIAWKIPWTEEPGRLQPTGSQRVGHDWVTLPYLTLPYLTYITGLPGWLRR